MQSAVVSEIGDNANVTTRVGDVKVTADHQTYRVSAAGAIALAGENGVGAGLNLVAFDKSVVAHVGDHAHVTSAHDVRIEATGSDDILSIAVGLSAVDAALAIAGSFNVLGLETRVAAAVGAANIDAQGNVVVASDSELDGTPIAGAAALADSGLAGLGMSANLVLGLQTTQSLVDEGAEILARGNLGATNVNLHTGDRATILEAAVALANSLNLGPSPSAPACRASRRAIRRRRTSAP
jgi:hypothetical protein